MNDEHFNKFTAIVAEYLENQKVFVQNPQRMQEVNDATEIACRLFPEAMIEIQDDPLQMGAVILLVEDFGIVVREPEKFAMLISNADNFEVYHEVDDVVRLAILFRGALIRIE